MQRTTRALLTVWMLATVTSAFGQGGPTLKPLAEIN